MNTYNNNKIELNENGITVLKKCFSEKVISAARQKILNNINLLKNTKPGEPSLHLAGFHKYPELERLHSLLSTNPTILGFLNKVTDGKLISIGNSDITINRSQHWHKDLLRGKYATYHNPNNVWGETGGGVYRIILYLQNSKSLNVVLGSHLKPESLENDKHLIPKDYSGVSTLSVDAGDIVVMDIRTTHSGMTPEYIKENEHKLTNSPSIMIATILGNVSRPLTKEMELGNFHRQVDWNVRNNARL